MDIFGILDPDPLKNLCGSETLVKYFIFNKIKYDYQQCFGSISVRIRSFFIRIRNWPQNVIKRKTNLKNLINTVFFKNYFFKIYFCTVYSIKKNFFFKDPDKSRPDPPHCLSISLCWGSWRLPAVCRICGTTWSPSWRCGSWTPRYPALPRSGNSNIPTLPASCPPTKQCLWELCYSF